MEKKVVKNKTPVRSFGSWSDNPKPVLSFAEGSAIQKPKWVGLLAIALAFTVCGAVVDAQQTGKVFRIGFLDTGTASGMAVLVEAFRQELNKLGWIEGKNIAIVFRFNDAKGLQHLPELVADLLRQKVDLIVATAGPAASATKKATMTIPIVMAN